MGQTYPKITYHLADKKINAYSKTPSTYEDLKKEIGTRLFLEHHQPRCPIRIFWIDEDNDEVDVVNQGDYEIFMAKRSVRHLQVAPIDMTTTDAVAATNAAAAKEEETDKEVKMNTNENQIYTNLRKNSIKSSVSSNLNNLESDKKSYTDTLIEKERNQEQTTKEAVAATTAQQIERDAMYCEVPYDFGSENESDSDNESFIKLDTLKETQISATASTAASNQTRPPQSLNKSMLLDSENTNLETAKVTVDAIDNTKAPLASITTTTSTNTSTNEPVVATTASTPSNSSIYIASNRAEEKYAVPVYHADERINKAVVTMMSMGFTNEGAYLTKLLEWVNGDITKALDLMFAAQR